jgi:hypothetical protein
MCNKCGVCWIDGLSTVHIQNGAVEMNDDAHRLHAILDGFMFILQSENGGDDCFHVWVQQLVWLKITLFERTKIVATVAAGILACPRNVAHDSCLHWINETDQQS